MMQGTYTAALGISSQQQRLDTIANNLANIGTNGYKTVRTDFKDAMYQVMQRPVQPQADLNLEKGHGTLISGFIRSFSPGMYTDTGRETDFYLDGDGFFTVQSQQGQTLYTRDGSYYKSVEADGTYLVTSDGAYLLGENGQRIRVQGEKVQLSPSGYLSEGLNTTPYARVAVVRFPNQNGLEAVSGNLFAQSDASGAPVQTGDETKVLQYAVEGSNVEMANEFSRLIRASRVFQLSSRALSTADEMDGTAIASRR